MIIVDDQSGSSTLFPFIRNLTSDALMSRIDTGFGDIMWIGNGPDDTELRVGVEYKKIDDVLTCMVDGRYTGHQAGGMIDNYDRRYLLVEGRIRCDRNTGIMQKLSGDRWRDISRAGRGFTYRELYHWFTTVEEMTQTRVVLTYDEHESARWAVMKHSWYVNKAWNEHTAFHQFHEIQPPTASIVPPSLIRRVAKELPDIRWERSIAVEAKFPSVREMINANVQTWQTIEGIGKTIANRVVNAITGGK